MLTIAKLSQIRITVANIYSCLDFFFIKKIFSY